MSLIKSISGIRGTIGGKPGEGLGATDIVKFASAYAEFIKRQNPGANLIVVGRDARISGEMVENLVVGALTAMGMDVVKIGLATTPTTEMAVAGLNADGGIIITASHNPYEWNALKLLDSKGEFLNDKAGKEVLRIAEEDDYVFAQAEDIGKILIDDTWLKRHVESILKLKLVNAEEIASKGLSVVVDGINSVGGIAVPALLKALGIKDFLVLNGEPTGKFAHTPEPLPENLTAISSIMKTGKYDVGFVVDPDVDRLAIVMENGEMFIEEYTLVAVADYILSHSPGNTVSNLSSTRALKDITEQYGCSYSASAVGEVNVVEKMKETGAVIGGEGNGGVIYPELHYGRDALVGIALFLSLLAQSDCKVSELKKKYPPYFISKNKIELSPDLNIDILLDKIKKRFSEEKVTDIDGVKIDFKESWVHLRKSNTEPIIRIYSEASDKEKAEKLAGEIKKIVSEIN